MRACICFDNIYVVLTDQRMLEKILHGHKSFCPWWLFVAWSTCNLHICVCIYCLSKTFLNMYLSVFSVIFVNNFAFGPQVDHHVSVVEGYLVILVILCSFPDPKSRTGVGVCHIVWKSHAVNAQSRWAHCKTYYNRMCSWSLLLYKSENIFMAYSTPEHLTHRYILSKDPLMQYCV